MKLYNISDIKEKYYDDNTQSYKTVFLKQGEVSQKDFQVFQEEFKNVSFGIIYIEKVENDTVYFGIDIV